VKTIIAIDPGAAGGIAISTDGDVTAYKMPDTLADIRDLLQAVPSGPVVIYCERVGTYMPGNSGPSAATFAEHVGALKGIICCLRIPVIFPTPQTWMNHFIGKQVYKEKKGDGYDDKVWKVVLTRRKNDRKNKIKAKAQELYPNLTITLKTADALGILHYGINQESIQENKKKEQHVSEPF
jgi:hypothetical protein